MRRAASHITPGSGSGAPAVCWPMSDKYILYSVVVSGQQCKLTVWGNSFRHTSARRNDYVIVSKFSSSETWSRTPRFHVIV